MMMHLRLGAQAPYWAASAAWVAFYVVAGIFALPWLAATVTGGGPHSLAAEPAAWTVVTIAAVLVTELQRAPLLLDLRRRERRRAELEAEFEAKLRQQGRSV